MNTSDLQHAHHRHTAFKCIVLAALLFLAAGYAAMLLWNWLIPALFHGPQITWLQSIGLLALARILVGHHGRRCGWRAAHQHNADNAALSEEERNKLRTCLFNKWRC